MIDEVIKISPRSNDLPKTKEFWQSDTYDERENAIRSFIVNVKKAPPSPNMQYIREGIFPIIASTTMEELQELAVRIKELCTIDCFQISINRKTKTCRMLFDWYDYEKQKCYYLYEAPRLNLSVLILRHLRLPLPKNLDSKWLRYFLAREYDENPNCYKELLDRLKHAGLSKEKYALAKKTIDYVWKVCSGTTRITL